VAELLRGCRIEVSSARRYLGSVGSNRMSSRLFSSYRLIRLATTLPEERYAIATGCGSRSVRGGES
jgi:hypothetical protein